MITIANVGCPYKSDCKTRRQYEGDAWNTKYMDRELCDTKFHKCGGFKLKQELGEKR